MKTRTAEGRGGGGRPGPPRLPEEPPAGETTRTARSATVSAQTPERNSHSRRDGRVTAPDSAAQAFVLPPFKAFTPPPPPPQATGLVSTATWSRPSLRHRLVDFGKCALDEMGGAKTHGRSLECVGGLCICTWKVT